MKIYLGTDHAGFEMKEKMKSWLEKLGHEVVDKGAFEFTEDDDYPDFIIPVADSVASEVDSFGVVFGGTGQGEAFTANRTRGVRAIVYYGGSLDIVKLGREKNNANILSIGARFVSQEETQEAIKVFLETSFSRDERHVRRINKAG